MKLDVALERMDITLELARQLEEKALGLARLFEGEPREASDADESPERPWIEGTGVEAGAYYLSGYGYGPTR